MIKKKKFTLRTLFGALWYLCVCALVVILISVLGAKLRGQVPGIGGFSLLRIVSGSMEPTISPGTYILVRDTDPRKIRPGDIITFYSDNPLIQGMPNTHRVVECRPWGEDSVSFVTQGDANVGPDSTLVPADRLIGRYVKSLNGLTAFADFCADRWTLLVLAAIPLAGAFVMALSVQSIKNRIQDLEDEENGPKT